MKSLWLAVIVLSVVLVKTEDSDVFGNELVMGALQILQTNIHALEQTLKSFDTKVDQRLSKIESKVDGIITATTKKEQIFDKTTDASSCSRCPSTTGVTLLQSLNDSRFEVYCENGWIVIQRRINGSLSFDRMWDEYRNGFGDVGGEYWLGLEKMHQITRGGSYELLVVLRTYDGVEKRAKYTGFEIASEEEQYRLDFEEFSDGDVKDSMTYHKGMKFSTPDQDNDMSSFEHCAEIYNSGWWFNSCYYSNLNGIHKDQAGGMDWFNNNHIIKCDTSRMMIRQIN